MASGYKFIYTGPIAGATLAWGELWMWGANGSGQLGDNSTISRSSPVQTITGGTIWSSISSGTNTSAAIKSDGTLWLWGLGTSGELGDNTIVSKSSPIQTVAGGSNWSFVSAGGGNIGGIGGFCGGIKTDGTLWMWGSNAYGQLGDNTKAPKSSPIQTIAGGSNWKNISCGYAHTAAIKTDGTLWVWGRQGYFAGQVGAIGDNTSVDRSSPVQTVAAGTNWSQVAAGYAACSAIKTDGTLWVWGNNAGGRLGTNDTANRSSPIQTVTGGTNWSKVAAGYSSNAALKTDGTLWVWGRNDFGQLGDNTIIIKSSPVQTGLKSTDWLDVWTGAATVRALKNDGRVFTWGFGTSGQLGSNSSINRSNPIQVIGSVRFKNVSTGGTNNTHGGAIGNSFTTALVDLSDVYQEKYYFSGTTGGILRLAGGGQSFLNSGLTYGQLGDNTTVRRSSPVQTVAGGSIWKQVSSGYYFTAGIKTDGTLWTWGRNDFGQLGDNTLVDKSSPIQTITAGTTWTAVSCGWEFTAALKSDGTLWTWGRNYPRGMLGDNTTVNKSSPVQTVAGGTNWLSVSAGRFNCAAIKADGTLWLWGQGNYGLNGDGTRSDRSSPVQTITGGTNWAQVSTGSQFQTAAIKTDGTLWTWGNNNSGGLGDNTTVSKSSPVQTIAGGTNWSQVSVGSSFCGAVKTDGTIWTWGQNTSGQLGYNTAVDKSSPAQTIMGGTNWKQVSSGFASCAAIQINGSLWAWGANYGGMFGDNTIINRSSPVQTIGRGSTWRLVSTGYTHISAIADY
jgi:alpha-tubulin suppressor-like RCC1 family protein